MKALLKPIIFTPLYNLLVGIMVTLPFIDLGTAVIVFTLIVRLILFPLSKNSILTQVRMKAIEPEVNKIKAQYSSDKQLQAVKTMELYKERGIKPFSGILLLFIQLPILLALVSVFYRIVPDIHTELLYPFILSHLSSILPLKASLFGLDLTHKSIVLSIITGIVQFFQMHFSLATRQTVPADPQKQDMAAAMSSMNTQMKFLLPVFAFISTYWLIPARFPQAAAIIALYWSVSSIFTLLQELYIRKKHLK